MVASKFKGNPAGQAIGKVLKQPLLTNTLRGTKYAGFNKYMLNPMQLLDVAGGVYAGNELLNSDSNFNKSRRDYLSGKGSGSKFAYNSIMTALSGMPVGMSMFKQGYGALAGGINALRKVPQVSGFKTGIGQVLKKEANVKDLFKTKKYTRFTKPGAKGSSKDLLWYNEANAQNINKYFPGKEGKASDIILTNAQASKYNASNIQKRVNAGKNRNIYDELVSSRSIAKKNNPDMVSYTNSIKDPKTKKLFERALDNPDNYWKLDGHTDKITELIAKAPASKDELAFSKKIFNDLKTFDAEKWTPNYNLVDDFTGAYGYGNRQAIKQSKKLFDYLEKTAKYSGKVSKMEKAEVKIAGED